jgi:hypothetical protein
MAAVLACGDGAALSHESAAALWGIRNGGLHPIEVSVPANRRIRLEGIRVHRRNPMPPTTTKRTIPLSRPLFTLVDLAATLPSDPLEAAINEADRLNLIDPETLEAGLDSIRDPAEAPHPNARHSGAPWPGTNRLPLAGTRPCRGNGRPHLPPDPDAAVGRPNVSRRPKSPRP